MNYKMIFKNVALSTLLLSAVAGPTVFADSSLPKAKLERVAVVSSTHLTDPIKLDAVTTTAAFQLLDPIKLAETYAKDTVKEWQATIAEYDKLLSKRFEAISIAEVTEADVVVPSLSLEKQNLAGTAQITLQAVPLTEKELASIKVLSVDGESAQLTSVPLQESGTFAVASIAATESAIELKASPFFEGMMALEKAVESKDEAAIRETLAKQLELYKLEISALSQDVDSGKE
ncbi:hypothetical protein [Paenibacillus luteus]|uniref:hypothetical protein n=1 Tax=Paenibacillus luteus TaxID=2545753 RepID=UPI001144729C|nr:hypothetical protein [Paenibacillus luteus]